ncbi:GLX3, partial [Symbiodinium sp. KB8]
GKQTGAYLPEIAHPYYVFANQGFEIEFASPKGGKVPIDKSSIENFKDDELCQKFMNHSIAWNALADTPRVEDLDVSTYKAIFFPGGHGPVFDLYDNDAIAKQVAKFYESGRPVGAVCHGSVALANMKLSNGKPLVEGKEVTGFSNAEEDEAGLTEYMPVLLENALKDKGAKYEKADNWQKKVTVSERLVTGQNPASAEGVAQEMIKLIK